MLTFKNNKTERKKLVSLSEAKSHLRITHNREDVYIDSLIGVASNEVENYLDFPISIYSANVEVDTIDYDPSYLFNYEVKIFSIKGFDINGVQVIGEYDIEQQVDKKLYINLIPENVVKLTFDIKTTDSPFIIIPESFKQATLITLGDLYSNRQEFIVGKSSVNLKLVERLLNPYKNVILR